jgi:hypothetical protein
MTGSTSVDMALVQAETPETFDNVNCDKIAEAEALAAEALRMANEAKRAAERLAEVKKTLAMFSKKLEKSDKVVIVKKPTICDEDDSTLFEAKKVVDAIVKKQEDAPVAQEPEVAKEEPKIVKEEPMIVKEEPKGTKEEPKSVEEPTDEELPPPMVEEEEEFVPPPPPVFVAAPSPKVRMAAPAIVEIVEEEKDILEAALDDLGVDKLCGVDDETLAIIEAKEMGLPAPIIVTKKVESKASLPVTREPAPKPEKQSTEIQIYGLTDDEDKDFLEKALDSWGIDRLCGVDDVTLGLADSYPEAPPPPKPVPFENPTRLEYKEVPALDILHAESMKEQRSKEIREKEHLPKKIYQRAPTNYDFIDPFGVDHDDFAICGRLADVCEPNLDILLQPEDYVFTAPRTPAALPEPEKSILKKEDATFDSVKNVSFQEAAEIVVSLRGVEPEGAKISFDSFDAHNEAGYTKMTHGHLRSTPIPSAEQQSVSRVVKVRSSSLRSRPVPEVKLVEEREEEQTYWRHQQTLKRHKALLEAVDSHLWFN